MPLLFYRMAVQIQSQEVKKMLRLNTMLTNRGFTKTMQYSAKDMWQKGTTAVIRYNKNKPRYVEVIEDNMPTSYLTTDPRLLDRIKSL